jgi:hypothetical protein
MKTAVSLPPSSDSVQSNAAAQCGPLASSVGIATWRTDQLTTEPDSHSKSAERCRASNTSNVIQFLSLGAAGCSLGLCLLFKVAILPRTVARLFVRTKRALCASPFSPPFLHFVNANLANTKLQKNLQLKNFVYPFLKLIVDQLVIILQPR